MPGSLSAAKFAQDGELFARMKLEDDLSVDSVAGRLILKSTNLVWLAPHKSGSKNNALPKKVSWVLGFITEKQQQNTVIFFVENYIMLRSR